MRKLILLAAMIVLVALVLILVNALETHAHPDPLVKDAGANATGRAPAPLDNGKGTQSDQLARESADISSVAQSSTTRSASLRIRISFAHQPEREPQGLEVRVSDLLGVQRDAHRESPLEFLVRGLSPADFVVAASESKSIAKTVRAHIEKDRGETMVDLE